MTSKAKNTLSPEVGDDAPARPWRWYLDEVFVRVKGERRYLWRAVDHEGEVFESFVTRKRDKAAALKFLRKALKRHGPAQVVFTDRLRSYRAAMKQLGNTERQEVGRRLNNRAETSHQPFRRRERAMQRFRRMKTLQQFVATHASFHNHFSQEHPPSSSTAFLGSPLLSTDPDDRSPIRPPESLPGTVRRRRSRSD